MSIVWRVQLKQRLLVIEGFGSYVARVRSGRSAYQFIEATTLEALFTCWYKPQSLQLQHVEHNSA